MKSSFLKIVMSRVPIFVILGSTGTGKSKLGVEIAKKFNGEIISADSMQVYKGLDVITNKVTPTEAEGIPHHMLDFLDPNTRFTVVDYRNQALKHIDDILQRNKIPIIVGGTNYYIESLLWSILVDNKTNINDQGQFTLYDIDKIRNLEHGCNVLERLWKIDNKDKAVKDLFTADAGADKDKRGQQNDDKVVEGERDEASQRKEPPTSGEKRKSNSQDNDKDNFSKKVKTNEDKKYQTEQIKISGCSEENKIGKNDVEMISKGSGSHMNVDTVNTTEIFFEKKDLVDSSRNETVNKPDALGQSGNDHTLNYLKTDDSKIENIDRNLSKDIRKNLLPCCELPNSKNNKESVSQIIEKTTNDASVNPKETTESLASNREGIKSLVTVLDSLRGKLITDIETANRFSLGVRTLKDMMKPPREEDEYDKVEFKSTNVKGMFEELDKKFGQIGPADEHRKREEMSPRDDPREPSTQQPLSSLYSDYKDACVKLTERFKYLTLLPKQFLYCLAIHQKSKSLEEKLSLYGLTPEELKTLRLSLSRCSMSLEEGVKKIASDPSASLTSEKPVPATFNTSEIDSEHSKHLRTLLTRYEHHISRLNDLIARRVENLCGPQGDAKSSLSGLLLKSTSLLRTLSASLHSTQNNSVHGAANIPVEGTANHSVESTVNHPVEGTLDHFVERTKYFLPTDSDRTNLTQLNLHRMLQEVDQPTAFNLHPNNIRKIVRALQVYYEQGRSLSDILSEQKALEGGSQLGGPLRFPNTVILWLQCDKAVLDKRLESRVHTMIENGLVSELLGFHRKYNEERLKHQLEPDYTKGIFQSIGFKEFHPYLTLSSAEERSSAAGLELFGRCVAALVLANVQYAKRQNQWVRNRLLKCPDRAVPPVYSLNCTDLSTWPQSVSEPALHIVESYLCNRPPSIEPLAKEFSDPSYYNAGSYPCDVCSRVFVGKHQYDQHMSSHKHRKVVAKMQRQLDHIMRVNQSIAQKGVKDSELTCASVEEKRDVS